MSIGFPLIVGTVVGATSAFFSVEFEQALIIALVSGLLAAAGTIAGVLLSVKLSRPHLRQLQDSVDANSVAINKQNGETHENSSK